jgi:hypothetical protein
MQSFWICSACLQEFPDAVVGNFPRIDLERFSARAWHTTWKWLEKFQEMRV